MIAVDQGEELLAVENQSESRFFLELFAAVLNNPPADVNLYMLMTIRADCVEALLTELQGLRLDPPESLYLPPLPWTAYRDVIVKSAEIYSQRVRRLVVEPALVEALTRDAQGADALPLLAFTLERLFNEFGNTGHLTLQDYEAMGGIGGSIDWALARRDRHDAEGPVSRLRRSSELVGCLDRRRAGSPA